jgi:hypothetical protein
MVRGRDSGIGRGRRKPSSMDGLVGDSSTTWTFVPLVISGEDRPHHAYTDRIRKTTDGVI